MNQIKTTTDIKTEEGLQGAGYRWFHNTYPELRGLLFAVPNGGNRNKREAARMRGTGIVPGVSDMLFLYRGRTYAIEFKNPGGTGRQSPAQVNWERLVRSQGFEYYLVDNLDYFKQIIESIIK